MLTVSEEFNQTCCQDLSIMDIQNGIAPLKKKKNYPGHVGLPSEFSKTSEETAPFLRETFKGGYK